MASLDQANTGKQSTVRAETVIVVARRREPIGIIIIADAVKSDAEEAIDPRIDCHSKTLRRHPGGFLLVADPVGLGLIQSLAHPGGQLTGFTNFEFSIGGKWVELLKQIDPNVSRIVLIANPGNSSSAAFSKQIEAAARSINLDARTIYVRDAAEIEGPLRSAGEPPRAALITLPDFLPVLHRDLIVKLTNELRIPAIHPFPFQQMERLKRPPVTQSQRQKR